MLAGEADLSAVPTDRYPGNGLAARLRRFAVSALMSSPHNIPRIRPEDFANFLDMFAVDSRFPRTYGSWLEQTNRLPGCGACRSIEVGSHEFLSYCRNAHAQPSLALLMTFTSLKAMSKTA